MAITTIGITGGIGSGKSVVSRILRCNGFVVYDCDTEAKRLMTEDLDLKEALKSQIGPEVYEKDGNLNRRFLSKKIFYDLNVRKKVNNLVHTAVFRDIQQEIDRHKEIFFVESAILATSSLTELCQEIWLVESPLSERIRRIINRDGLEEEEINRRIESQECEFEAIEKLKPIVLENDDHTSLLVEIRKLTDKNINSYKTC